MTLVLQIILSQQKLPLNLRDTKETKKRSLSEPESIVEGKYTGSKISFDFQDADIVPIFRLLSDISGYNIVVSPEVRGKITLNLINVPWDQALDIVLKTFYLGKSVEGNIIRIAPLSVFAKESEEKAKARIAELLVEPLETRVFHVNYADGAALEKTVKDLRILTPRGSISVDRRTSVIIIQDIPIVFSQVERILSILDKPTSVNDSRKINSVDATYEYDAFICHASEDKESFVRPLAKELRDKDLKVWYDEFSLKVGDSLRRSIDRGLSQSRFGIVVLSPSFFEKEWPQRELDGLTAREIHGVKVILPVWHNVSRADVVLYSPVLADRVGVLTNRGLDHVVAELIEVIQPVEKLLDEKALKFMRAIRLLLEENNKEYRVVVEHLSEMLEQAVPALIESETFSEFVRRIAGASPEIIAIKTYSQAENYLKLHPGEFRYTSYGGTKDKLDDTSATFLAIRHNDRHIIINSNALQKFESLHRVLRKKFQENIEHNIFLPKKAGRPKRRV